jgi:hypothetical protein
VALQRGTAVAAMPGMRLVHLCCFLALVAMTGCFKPSAQSLAFAWQKARPANCAIDFERASPHEAQAKWRQIGVVCLTVGWCDKDGMSHECTVDDVYRPGDRRDVLQAEACHMGGDVVTPIDLCAMSAYRGVGAGIEFGVYRAGEPSSADGGGT